MSHAIGLIDEENNIFGISFPDFPGCISTAATLDEVILRGHQALALHVEGMIEDKEPVPQPRGLAQLKSDAKSGQWFGDGLKNAVIVAVPVELPGKAVRVNISVDEHLLDRIDRAAQAAGQSRSAYLADAARCRIAESASRAA